MFLSHIDTGIQNLSEKGVDIKPGSLLSSSNVSGGEYWLWVWPW